VGGLFGHPKKSHWARKFPKTYPLWGGPPLGLKPFKVGTTRFLLKKAKFGAPGAKKVGGGLNGGPRKEKSGEKTGPTGGGGGRRAAIKIGRFFCAGRIIIFGRVPDSIPHPSRVFAGAPQRGRLGFGCFWAGIIRFSGQQFAAATPPRFRAGGEGSATDSKMGGVHQDRGTTQSPKREKWGGTPAGIILRALGAGPHQGSLGCNLLQSGG